MPSTASCSRLWTPEVGQRFLAGGSEHPPCCITLIAAVPARRTLHQRFNDLTDPEPIPVATDYASVIESDVPIVVQHSRLDSRQSENALLSTIAFPG